jgi:flagellar protein FliO/FliZ
MNWLGPLASFIAVLALIPVALWLLKRTPISAGAATSAGMRVIASLPIAPNQRLLTVEVGQGSDRQWLVLGVTPAGIRTLHTLPPQADLPSASPAVGLSFAQLLGRTQRPPEDSNGR